jgi:hypothetical protein
VEHLQIEKLIYVEGRRLFRLAQSPAIMQREALLAIGRLCYRTPAASLALPGKIPSAHFRLALGPALKAL